MASPPPDPVPVAELETQPRLTRWLLDQTMLYWGLAAAALLLALLLALWANYRTGPRIVVYFQQGYGLKAGDQLRHRGIDVGEVRTVQLDEQQRRVVVEIQLETSAAELARAGSRFWIERPQVSVSRVRGLDTIMGAKYVAVSPGHANASAKYEFQGEEHPLTVASASSLEISVRFRQGHGLVVGDPLRHRGIVVGEVTAIDLNEDLTGVIVRVRVSESAERLARAGSRFWVERVQLDMQGIRGLETLVGGRYLAVDPGPPEGASLNHFVGLEQAPPGTGYAGDGLELILESPARHGVHSGTPVTYRGLAVGSVLAVELAPDATQIEFRISIQPDYVSLIRADTRFWVTSGFDVNWGFGSVELNAETLETIAAGGIAFATPTDAGKRVATGHRFVLHEEGEADWLSWSPRLPAGPMSLSEERSLPRPQRLLLEWSQKRFGFLRQQRREGLALLLSDGRILAARELCGPPAEAVDGSSTLTIAGSELAWQQPKLIPHGELATYRSGRLLNAADVEWPADRTRRPAEPENCWLVTDLQPPVPLAAGRWEEREDTGWSVHPSFPVLEHWSGAPLVAVTDGALIGLLIVDAEQKRARIALVP